MRRKKWLCLSLALIGCLALSLAVFSRGAGNEQAAAKEKMPLFLQQLCDLYQGAGVKKLADIPGGKKGLAPRELADLLWPEELPARKGAGPQTREPLDLLFDPAIQKRWNRPEFDVCRGTLTAASDPRDLESPYLKIRRAWKRQGVWHSFCEFAPFKANEIAAADTVVRLDLMPTPQLENDLGSASTGAPRLRVGTPGNWESDRGLTGAGVIVGDVDSGIDWTHGDFLNPDGTTRILYLWDTEDGSNTNTPTDLFGMPADFDYGRIWTKAEIDGGFCTATDTNGHGTHTCGTAAGNGGATGKYTGMAPNADIIYVKGLDMWGDEFVFEVAHQMGRPSVVNNSYGYSWTGNGYLRNYPQYIYYFPGDGTCYESQYIAYLNSVYPRGAFFVNSGGNEGMWQTYKDHLDLYDYRYALYDGSLHFGGKSTSSNFKTYTYARQNYAPGHPELPGIYLERSHFWVRSDKPVKVTFVTGVKTYAFETGTSGNFNDAFSTGTSFNMNLADPYNGEYCGYILFRENTANPGWGPGNWKIRVKPLNAGDKVNFDVWLDSQLAHQYPGGSIYWDWNSCFTTNAKHDEYMLDFSASEHVITAGAWTTRKEYLAADGYTYYPWGFLEPKLNTIVYFSSPGPSRDGRMKPEIAAPGAVIMSAASKDAGWTTSELDPDMRHGWMWGTSMACPHATGGIALMLQRYPNLTIGEVRTMLTNWAVKDRKVMAIGKNGFGAGKLNVLKAACVPVPVITVDKAIVDLSNHETATFFGSDSYDPCRLPFSVDWKVTAAPEGAKYKLVIDEHLYTATLIPDAAITGTYKVSMFVDGQARDSAWVTATVKAVE